MIFRTNNASKNGISLTWTTKIRSHCLGLHARTQLRGKKTKNDNESLNLWLNKSVKRDNDLNIISTTLMFERFTEKAIKVVMLAQEEARRLGHNFVGTEQILLGLIGESTGIAAKVLKSMGVTLKEARIEVEKIIGRGSGFVAVEIPFTPRAKRVLEISLDEARQLGHNYIGTEHILLGLLREGEGVAARVLETLRLEPTKIRTQVIRLVGESQEAVGAGVGASGSSSNKSPTLEEYGTDLTAQATDGKLDPVVGRKKEIDRVMQILGRRTKNNPCLVGEPGVGKTAVAEGLAQKNCK